MFKCSESDSGPTPVPPDELERARKHQEFCAKRAQQLHDQGVGAFEANTQATILRELHRDALRKAHRSDTPADNSDPISNSTADVSPTEEPIAKKPAVKSNLTKAEKQKLCYNPDTVCVECGSGDIDSKYSSLRNKTERVQILICDCCDQGYHNSCLGLKWQPRSATQHWRYTMRKGALSVLRAHRNINRTIPLPNPIIDCRTMSV